jgi:hypothetical protein
MVKGQVYEERDMMTKVNKKRAFKKRWRDLSFISKEIVIDNCCLCSSKELPCKFIKFKNKAVAKRICIDCISFIKEKGEV